MARSALCPVHFLFFVLRAGGHNGVQLGILREAVNKRDGGIPEEQQPFAGIGTVSYTHLDVYKRQGVLRTRDGSILKQADGKSSVQNSLWREKLYTITCLLYTSRCV